MLRLLAFLVTSLSGSVASGQQERQTTLGPPHAEFKLLDDDAVRLVRSMAVSDQFITKGADFAPVFARRAATSLAGDVGQDPAESNTGRGAKKPIDNLEEKLRRQFEIEIAKRAPAFEQAASLYWRRNLTTQELQELAAFFSTSAGKRLRVMKPGVAPLTSSERHEIAVFRSSRTGQKFASLQEGSKAAGEQIAEKLGGEAAVAAGESVLEQQ